LVDWQVTAFCAKRKSPALGPWRPRDLGQVKIKILTYPRPLEPKKPLLGTLDPKAERQVKDLFLRNLDYRRTFLKVLKNFQESSAVVKVSEKQVFNLPLGLGTLLASKVERRVRKSTLTCLSTLGQKGPFWGPFWPPKSAQIPWDR